MPKSPPRYQLSISVQKPTSEAFSKLCNDTGRSRTSFLTDVVEALAEAKSPEDFNARCLAVLRAARGGKP